MLSLPIVGLDGFSVDRPVVNFREPAWLMDRAPGRRPCPAPQRSKPNEEQWRAVVDLVDRGLKCDGEARKRAGARLARMAPWKRFTASEELQLADSLWGSGWREEEGLPEGVGVHSWVFVDLPEPEEGVALERLRSAWSRGVDSRDRSQESLEQFLGQVGSALGGLHERGVDVVLSDQEAAVLRAAVEQWAEQVLGPTRVSIFGNVETRWRATRAVAKLLLRLNISDDAASRLGQRVRALRHDEVPVYELVPGILNSDPEQVGPLAWELGLGLAGTKSEQLTSAAHGLFLWLEATKDGELSLPPTPVSVLLEIGVIVANRRWDALSRALEVTEWVLRDGTLEQQSVLREPVLEGLGHLLEELVYEEDVDRHPFIKRPWVDHEKVDVPLLRWRCVRTARAMNAAGAGDEPVVRRWLDTAEEDPLPEVRYLVEGREGTERGRSAAQDG